MFKYGKKEPWRKETMMLEIRTVGRKTPKDGKLEITEATARRLAAIGAEIPVRIAARAATAALSSMLCSCGKANVDGDHLHHFLQCELFRELKADQTVALELIEGGVVDVALPNAL